MQTIDGMLILMQFAFIEPVSLRGYRRIIHLYPDMAEEDTPQFAGIIGGTLEPITPQDIVTYDLEDSMVNAMVFLVPDEE